MAEIIMRKLANGALIPQDDEAAEQLKHIKVGAGVRVTLVRVRNYKFLQKFHVLVGVLFDIWCETAPRLQYKGHDVAPNKEKFRADLTVLCGHYDAVFGVRGELQLKAKSISFASMDEEEFERLYSTAIDIGLGRILNRPDWTPEKIRQACEDLMRFTD